VEQALLQSNTKIPVLLESSTISDFNPKRLQNTILLPGAKLPSWKFWPSQWPLSTSLHPGRKLSSFWSSFGRCPAWCYPPICIWVFLAIFWL